MREDPNLANRDAFPEGGSIARWLYSAHSSSTAKGSLFHRLGRVARARRMRNCAVRHAVKR